MELALGSRGKLRETVFMLQHLMTDGTQLVASGGGQTEDILESAHYRGVVKQKLVKTARKTGDDHDGVVVPMVHLNKEFV